MKKFYTLFLLIAIFSCQKGETEYIKIKDVFQGELTTGTHEFNFRMIESGEFRILTKLDNIELTKDFSVVNSFLKADTTNNDPTGPTQPLNSLSLNKSDYLIDEDIFVELITIASYTANISVYKKSE